MSTIGGINIVESLIIRWFNALLVYPYAFILRKLFIWANRRQKKIYRRKVRTWGLNRWGQWKSASVAPDMEPQVEPEEEPEEEPDPDPEAEAEPQAELLPEPQAELLPEPQAEPQAEPEPEPEPSPLPPSPPPSPSAQVAPAPPAAPLPSAEAQKFMQKAMQNSESTKPRKVVDNWRTNTRASQRLRQLWHL